MIALATFSYKTNLLKFRIIGSISVQNTMQNNRAGQLLSWLFFVIILTVVGSYSWYKYKTTEDIKPKINSIFAKYKTSVEEKVSQIKETVDSAEENVRLQEEYTHGYQDGPAINIKRESYFVQGSDRTSLCDQIASEERKLGNNYVQIGHIQYGVGYKYYAIRNKSGYTIGEFSVSADSTITVPQWESSAGASDDTKNDWRVFKNSVVEHEDSHQEILEKYATTLVSEFNKLPYYGTQAEIDSAVSAAYDKIMKEMDTAQEYYDDHYESKYIAFCNNKY